MVILFLDIDGVLNTGRGAGIDAPCDGFGITFNPDTVENFSRIITETGAEIVISSSWKFLGLNRMQEMWKERDLPGKVIGTTPNTVSDEILLKANLDEMDGMCFKGMEIKEWLSKHGDEVRSYAIIDDENLFLPEQQSYFVQTNLENGITKEDAERVIKILTKD